MRNGIVWVLLLVLMGCSGGGSSSSTGGGSNPSSGSGGSPPGPSLPGGGGSVPVRVLELINKTVPGTVKALGDEIRPAALAAANNGISPQISADGRFVSFSSQSPNMVAGDTNAVSDVFVRDRSTATTVRANYLESDVRTHAGAGEYAFSADLKWLVFNIPSLATPPDFLVKNVLTDQISNAGQGFITDQSPDGRYTAYWTQGPPARGQLLDRQSSQIIDIAPTANSTVMSGRFSADGSLLYFYSEATNLAPVDTNGVGDVFSYRLSDGKVSLVSVLADGTQFNGRSLPGRTSLNGRYYVFSSEASNLAPNDTNNLGDVFVQDNQTGKIVLVSRGQLGPADGDSTFCSISGDGRLIAFNSVASNLVSQDTNKISDVFLFDREQGSLLGRVSLSEDRHEALGGDDRFRSVEISSDGKWIAFTSEATNLIKGVGGGYSNVYVTNAVVPQLFEPPGPHANAYELLLTGNTNIDMSPFSVAGAHSVSGGFIPQSGSAQGLFASVFVPGASFNRQVQFNVNLGGKPVAVGQVVTLPDPNGTEVRYTQMDPAMASASYAYREGSSGMMTIVSFTPGAGSSGTVGIRLDDWEMVANTAVVNPATGSFRFNGTLTFTIP